MARAARAIGTLPLFFPKSNLGDGMPIVYDPNWQTYTDLSPTQIAAFMNFPEWKALHPHA